MRILLTPGQAVTAHGWTKAREFLTWGDVLNNERLTFRFMVDVMKMNDINLHNLQPDLQSWIKHKKVDLEDCPLLHLWDAHPIKDFGADLADLIRMRWQADVYKKLGVYYDSLVEIGLTPETMILFGFTLMNWASIGFTRAHCENIPEYIVHRLFMMQKTQVLSCLK